MKRRVILSGLVFVCGAAAMAGASVGADSSAAQAAAGLLEPSKLLRLFGRLHPLTVHFPIALIATAAVVELVRLVRRPAQRSPMAYGCLVLGVLGAAAAAWFGWLNAAEAYPDGSGGREVFIHRWSGIGLAGVGALAVLLGLGCGSGERRRLMNWYRMILSAALALVVVTGHFGGELVHGEGYVLGALRDDPAPAPAPAPRTVPVPVIPDGQRDPAAAARTVDFDAQVRPIFQARCVSCHGERRQRARLRLDRRDGVFGADESRWVILPGDADGSELVHRIELPADDPDVMPARGEVLTTEQITLIRRWIDEGAHWEDDGAPTTTAPAETTPDAAVPEDRAVPVEDPIAGLLAAIRQRGGLASAIAQDTDGVEVNFSLADPPVGDDDLSLLAGLEGRLEWLNLRGSAVTDDGLRALAGMTRLRRLHLERTAAGDPGLAHLRELTGLEYLNLYGTGVTDQGLESLHGLPSLRRVFVWQTGVTETGAAALREAVPGVMVILGGE